MFHGQHFLVAVVLFGGALAWECPAESIDQAGAMNEDCAKLNITCGKLVLTKEQGGETVLQYTRPCVGFKDGNGVKCATVEGPGCYYMKRRTSGVLWQKSMRVSRSKGTRKS